MKIQEILASGMKNVHVTFANPNSGGCGYVAQAMYKVLSELNVEVKVILIESPHSWFSRSARDLANAIEEYGATDINDYYAKVYADHGDIDGCHAFNAHLAIRVAGVLYDSEGVLNEKYTAISDGVSPESLELLLKSSCWNSTFKWHNEEIQDIPSEMYKQVASHFAEAQA